MTASVPNDALTSTRRSLHQVAEHVLSAARKRATGREIALVPGEGGVRTPPLPDGRVIALIDGDIAVIGDDGVRRAPLTTPRAAAEFVGTEPGFPWTKHPPGTESMPDAPLVVDGEAARVLADWFALGEVALRELATTLAPGAEPTPQIYPEHFDLAITIAEVNYGASPGDDAIAVPYLYVGPFAGPPAGDEQFWNAAFGAYTTISEVGTAAAAVAFFVRGHELLGMPTSPPAPGG
jgi:hypothetical protein